MSPLPGHSPTPSNPSGDRPSPGAPGRRPRRGVDRAVAVTQRQTLTGALERVADQHPSVAVPEVLYTDLSADVTTVMRRFLLDLLKQDELRAAVEVTNAVVRLMALQPSRRWLDARLMLRVALLVHEAGGDDPALLASVREMVVGHRRWYAAVARHNQPVDVGNPDDWKLVSELTALPRTFPVALRTIISKSVIQQDVLTARSQLTAYARRHREAAITARRALDQHAPSLASLYSAELTPTRRVTRVMAEEPTPPKGGRWRAWLSVLVLVVCGSVTLLVSRPAPAHQQHEAVAQICAMVGAEHPGCLIASSVATGLDHGDCAMVSTGLSVLEEQLSGFGLNRELAVIRADALGELRGPFSELDASYTIHCM